jgi:hypothetical protein
MFLQCPTPVAAAGVPFLVALYVDLHPDVSGFLERRHLNTVALTEVPPQCAVTTGLLVALHHTAHGKNDVLDRVIQMDDHPWISVPADLSKEDQQVLVKKRRKALSDRIDNFLSKLTTKGKGSSQNGFGWIRANRHQQMSQLSSEGHVCVHAWKAGSVSKEIDH